ncbi:small VCP/p97-interacting protein [Planococcus citri]|uniref:small VCP/p97-interacting protein n=1 Tax=Planococcus citri TaxID=170843 RepID=UPI0031F859DE
MGVCSSCFGDDSNNSDPTPDPEVRRQQQLEAVEKRLREQENRGIKNPDKVRRMQEKAKEKDRLQDEAATRYDGSGGLKWQVS